MKLKKEISPQRAERNIKKKIDKDTSEAVLDNTRMLNLLELGFGPEHISLSKRKRKR